MAALPCQQAVCRHVVPLLSGMFALWSSSNSRWWKMTVRPFSAAISSVVLPSGPFTSSLNPRSIMYMKHSSRVGATEAMVR